MSGSLLQKYRSKVGGKMKKQHIFIAYVLIGLGVYFLAEQLQLSLFEKFYSWPTFLMIFGIAFLIYSYTTKDYYHLFTGTLLLGLGIHFHGMMYYTFWYDHWAMYPLIVGISFFIRYLRTKNGLIISIIFIGFSLFIIFSNNVPSWLKWVNYVSDFVQTFWPVVLIICGIYILKRKR